MNSCSIASFLTILWINLVHGRIIPDQKNTYDVHGNMIQPTEHRYDPNAANNCCIVPNCSDGKCYDTYNCGHPCSEGNYRTISNYPTRGYTLKNFYEKYECHFGECKNYKFMCNHCPDPRLPDFSIYTLRKDCMNCYY